ncbi:response regulator [Nodosilinea sp. LEGE 06152]|uniref:hybrid sensor histidine kinase/response regulator n=1 Tax=Nodosilinea sp. LEGE 06152 TaxID=2777966 RepID=UPI001881DCEB|nr:response regulator [Nodosilinea sp. LEGE 06152]MBE9155454.1 response regulator [Nodosilinea sp. LEGE 06152]
MTTPSPVNILLVDDQPENLVALEAILGDLGVNLVKSTSGKEALRCLLQDDFALILLDVQMPQMDGFEVATLIRQRPRSQDTPIIFLTAFSSSEQFMFKGYALGAVDYLIKPIAPNVLLSKVAIFIELFKKTEALRQKTETLQQQAAQLEAINTELQTSEERFRLLSTCSPLGVFVTDTEGRCVYTNPRFQVICGRGPELAPAAPAVPESESASGAVPGQSWLDSVHPDDLAAARSTWAAYLQTGQDYVQEFRLRPRGEIERWASVRSARMVSEQKNFLGYVGTVEDITERKRAEAANAQVIREQAARQEAETANRMKDDFIAVLSHELRTPLNSILGWANLLQAGKLDSQKVEYAIDTIERNALAQKQLIEDILDVSQIVRGKLQLHRLPVNLVAVAQTALETVRPAATAKAIALTTNFHDYDRLEVTGDALRLQQVIWNLLTNAVKFTPEQGRVDVHLSVVTRLPKETLSADPCPENSPEDGGPENGSRAPAYAQLRITDTGLGIAADFLPHIFDRFRQADSSITRSQGGLGLGLAIVHHLVEQHQGCVWAESDGLNQGAAFTVALPLAQSTSPQPPSALDRLPNEPPTRALRGLPILIVEDDTDTRDFLAFLLQTQGAVVTTTASAEEGLRLVDSVQPAVLLCDISMPDMDGYTLIRKIRNQLPAPQANIPAIAITAHARLSDQAQALSNGFQSHLPKPIEAETLVRTILQVTNSVHDLSRPGQN